MLSKELIKKYGKLYSEELGINLASKKRRKFLSGLLLAYYMAKEYLNK